MIPISATILTKNSEAHLTEVLESLRDLDEVVILDNGSTDTTLEIAQCFENTSIYKSEFIGFGPLKNLAATYARNDWILSIDSDEVADKNLIHELRSIKKTQSVSTLYKIKRDNYFMKTKVNNSGWGKDYLVRIYNRKSHSFTNAQVHESIKTSNQFNILLIDGSIKHYAVDDVLSFLTKIKRYSALSREKEIKRISPFYIVVRSAFAFFKTYFMKKGFLDGYIGLVIAVSDANGVFYKYIKAYSRGSL